MSSRHGLLLLPLLVACSELHSIRSNECGNAVIEAGEDCDSFAPDASSFCRPPGSAGQCHLDCSLAGDGTRPSCPSGWGCDESAICRPPTGRFDDAGEAVAAGAWSLSTGDFDGDGRADLLSREPFDSITATHMSFHYFDEHGALEQSYRFPKLAVFPVVAELSHDQRSDVVFSDGRVGVMLGRRDRSWVPETFGTYRVSDPDVRMLVLWDRPIAHVSALAALVTYGTDTGVYLPSPDNGVLGKRVTIPDPTGTLAGDPVAGDLLQDKLSAPCWETVWAATGGSSFTVMNPCIADASGEPAWRDEFTLQTIPLEPPAAVDHAPLLADLNADGHLDVLLSAGGRSYVSYSDGTALAPAVPFELQLANSDQISPAIPMPIAVGDFSGDGLVDFVFSEYVLLSIPTPGSALPSYVPTVVDRLTAPWTVAKIADLNHDSYPDLALASRGSLNIEFYIGNGTKAVIPSTISTAGPVKDMTVADFDGDQTLDLAFVEGGIGSDPDSIKVVYGPIGPALLSQPEPATTIAHIQNSNQLTVFNDSTIGNLVVASTDRSSGEPAGVLTLFDGEGDRIPFAPLPLTTFSSTGSVEYSSALAVAAGSFVKPGSSDVLALGTPNLLTVELWLAAGVESSSLQGVRLAAELDSRLTPFLPTGIDFISTVASASADLDGDGRDEAVFVMPSGAAQASCGVLVVGAGSDPTAMLAPREPLIWDSACTDAQPQLIDVDGDRFPELVLLSGPSDGLDRKLWVFWNDGRGGFSTAKLSSVPADGAPLRGFSALPPAAGAPFRFAYVTTDPTDSVELVELLDGAHAFSEPRTLSALPHATGIVAADVNGDGVRDLALAASGKLSVLKAELSAP